MILTFLLRLHRPICHRNVSRIIIWLTKFLENVCCINVDMRNNACTEIEFVASYGMLAITVGLCRMKIQGHMLEPGEIQYQIP